jgi:hypothetical protein
MFRRAAKRRTSFPGSGLHVCIACRRDYVHAEGRRREDDGRWRLWLHCGECHARREVVVPDDLEQRFEADVERGRAALRALIDAGDFRP